MSSKQTIGPAVPGSLADMAVAASRNVRDQASAERVAQGKDITSLNRLLQWGAANSVRPVQTSPPPTDCNHSSLNTSLQLHAGAVDKESHHDNLRQPQHDPRPSNTGANPSTSACLTNPQAHPRPRTVEELKKDREWLDAAFPDMFAEVRRLSAILAGIQPPGRASDEERNADPVELDDHMRIDILNELEEYMADLNYATNISKLGTLAPVLEHTAHPNPRVRAAAFWVIGTAMQDFDEPKNQVMHAGGTKHLLAGLADTNPFARSKACMAVSSFLKHAKPDIITAFRDEGGTPLLQAALTDDDANVRRRALFFLQHCRTTGNSWFVEQVLDDSELTQRIAAALSQVPMDDCVAIEASVGAVQALVQQDRERVLELVPALPANLERLLYGVDQEDTRACLRELLDSLLSTFP